VVVEMKTLVVMPAYNEAANIVSTIRRARQNNPDVDIVVIDDGSMDETGDLAVEAGATVLPLPINLGYGGALQTGFIYAEAHGYDEVVQLDADGQHEPANIKDLLQALRDDHADIVIGSRFLGVGDYKAPPARAMGMALMRWLTQVSTGKRISDPTSGFQAVNRKAISLYASEVYPSDYPDADVLIMVQRAGLRVREIPVQMYQREAGVSMHSGILKPAWYMFKMLMSIGLTMLRKPPAVSRSG
jgi:glycosyltransferase involved in cell wall biosynthesis